MIGSVKTLNSEILDKNGQAKIIMIMTLTVTKKTYPWVTENDF